MTRQELSAAFERASSEFLQFDQIAHPVHSRRDICAFLMLATLCPGTGDMVDCAEHDKIWLNVDVDALAVIATDDIVRDLQRCGVMYDTDVDRLTMFV